MTPQRSMARSVFAIPTIIGLTSIVGLISALTGDGWRDLLSWLALATPVCAVMWAYRVRRKQTEKPRRNKNVLSQK